MTGTEIARYVYQDEHGNDVYTKVRYEPKSFAFFGPDGSPGIPEDAPNVPYRLPELLKAIESGWPVYLVEGEKDADRLASLGEAATTARDGADRFAPDFFGWFYGADVIVIADRDKAGLNHAESAVKALRTVANRVIAVKPSPGVEAGKADVSDHLDAGYGLHQLEPVQFGGLGAIRASEVQIRPTSWLWRGWLPYEEVMLLEGDPEVGKSSLAAYFAAQVATGQPWPGETERRDPADVLWITSEEGFGNAIVPRVKAAGGDLKRVSIVNEIPDGFDDDCNPVMRPVSLPDDLPRIEEEIRASGAKLVVLDVLVALFNPKYRAKDGQDARRVLSALKGLAERTGCCIVGIRHRTKGGKGGPAIDAGQGAVDLVGTARLAMLVIVDPDDETEQRRIMAIVKSNNGAHPVPWSFTLAEVPELDVVKVSWGDRVDTTANKLSQADGDKHGEEHSALTDARSWLRLYLEQSGKSPYPDLRKTALAQGISERTLQRAGKALGVVKTNAATVPCTSHWELPAVPAVVPGICPGAGITGVTRGNSGITSDATGIASHAKEASHAKGRTEQWHNWDDLGKDSRISPSSSSYANQFGSPGVTVHPGKSHQRDSSKASCDFRGCRAPAEPYGPDRYCDRHAKTMMAAS